MNGLTRCDEPAGVIIGPITLAGQRLWAQEGRECAVGDCWLILPGQGVASHPEPVIFSEHAWQVREGEVELRLHVVPGSTTQLGLGVVA